MLLSLFCFRIPPKTHSGINLLMRPSTTFQRPKFHPKNLHSQPSSWLFSQATLNCNEHCMQFSGITKQNTEKNSQLFSASGTNMKNLLHSLFNVWQKIQKIYK